MPEDQKQEKEAKKNSGFIWTIIISAIVIIAVAVVLFNSAKLKSTGDVILNNTNDSKPSCNGDEVILYSNLCWKNHYLIAKNWSDANDSCANLTLNGYDDWRLPTLEELSRLTKGKSSPINSTNITESNDTETDLSYYIVNIEGITLAKNRNHWTSTEGGIDGQNHAYVRFESGYTGFASSLIHSYGYVCVRSV